MQPNHPVLSGLIKLHADLGGQIFKNRQEAKRLAEDMRHIEAVIRMFEPSFDVRRIAIKRRQQGNPWFKRGTVFRHAVDVLRNASEPLSAREIAEAMLAAKGATDAKPKAVSDLTASVLVSLRNNEGQTVRTVGSERPAKWGLI
jgi:hypothetical protein